MLMILLPSTAVLGIVICHLATFQDFGLYKTLYTAVGIIFFLFALMKYDERHTSPNS